MYIPEEHPNYSAYSLLPMKATTTLRNKTGIEYIHLRTLRIVQQTPLCVAEQCTEL